RSARSTSRSTSDCAALRSSGASSTARRPTPRPPPSPPRPSPILPPASRCPQSPEPEPGGGTAMTLQKRRAIRWCIVASVLLGLPLWLYSCMIPMPGKSHRGPLPPLTPAQGALAAALRRDVVELAEKIGERNVQKDAALKKAAEYVEAGLRVAGPVVRLSYLASGRSCDNLEVEIRGASTPQEIVVVGAHYDSVLHSPGANDNASGVA